ncbi:MAG: SbcC/MukB-like Walker B domain-containing protein [Ignavibacteria bacterium]
MQEQSEIIREQTQTGFRLQRFEMLNWGTFDKKIWKIEPHGSNSLLTGDIGSGKSTLVDAITTLLVPHQKIVYNKAAGAGTKERTLYAYVRGEYKNERNEFGAGGKPVYLRNENDYTVLLAHFHNAGYNQNITLAQVFYIKDKKEEKFFVLSTVSLNIAEHFSNFGAGIGSLKKKLKNMAETEIFEKFSEYSIRFRNIFGIKSEKALDLLYQTVSMKSVGNLTDFVRNHMLEKTDVKEKIQELRRNFENLTLAHQSVLKAKSQVEELIPLIDEAAEYEIISSEAVALDERMKAIPYCIAEKKIELLKSELRDDEVNKNILGSQLEAVSKELSDHTDSQFRIKNSIEYNVEGHRLLEIDREIVRLNDDRKRKVHSFDEYIKLAQTLGLQMPENNEQFTRQRHQAVQMEKSFNSHIDEIEKKTDLLKLQRKEQTDKYENEREELESLTKRKTQIPESNLRIRELIIQSLNLSEKDVPFAGELIRVRQSESAWEGAAERLLRSYGLSILVPDKLYQKISSFINSTNIRGRLVYFRVIEDNSRTSFSLSGNSLLNKLEIKRDTIFHNFLHRQLYERFNYECCENMEDFFRHSNAITKEGQLKSGRLRHEKDDRSNILDKRNYILGWSNADKVSAIKNGQKLLLDKIGEIDKQLETLKKEKKILRQTQTDVHDFLMIKEFSSVNWKKDAGDIERLKYEKEDLEKSSDKLKTMRIQLTMIKDELTDCDNRRTSLIKELTTLENKINLGKRKLEDNSEVVQLPEAVSLLKYSSELFVLSQSDEITLENIGQIRDNLFRFIESQKEQTGTKLKKVSFSLIKKMQNYKNACPDETIEIDASLESVEDFRALAEKLRQDDLPKFEQRFKSLLNEGTIQDIVLFKNQLDISGSDIRNKVRDINHSLKAIEYDKGTYIELGMTDSVDSDIKEFKTMLRVALENSEKEEMLYTEEKFGRVKEIIDRFNSLSQADINWTHRVTDVRNWYNFTASERWIEDNTEKEFYSDSSGKSGGQKEKLAYTILASALAYQFGIEWKEKKSRSFRFVMIDEAFGRGSDESTRYALELFRMLKLQLLIITPLQKINVIEDYIDTVHYVFNQEGNNSLIKNLSITEYLTRKAAYSQQ